MKITRVVQTISENSLDAKICYDFRSKMLHLSNKKGQEVWVGSIKDLKENELMYEVLPQIEEQS